MAKLRDGPDYIMDVIDGWSQPDPDWHTKLLRKGDSPKPVLANICRDHPISLNTPW